MRKEPSGVVWALGALLVALSPGCATSMGVAELAGVRWRDRSRTRVSPLGEEQHRVEVTSREGEPLRVSCTVRSRHERERLSDESWTFTPWRRVLMGAFAAGEGAVAAWALLSGVDGDPRSVPSLALGGALGADALVTALLALFLQEGHRVEEIEVAGHWATHEGCPSGLALEYGGRRLPVERSGRLTEADERWLIEQLVERGGAARLALGPRGEEVWPTQSQRCAWAREGHHPAAEALCPSQASARERAPSPTAWRVGVTLEATGSLEPDASR